MNKKFKYIIYIIPFVLWELLSNGNVIDRFYFSSPSSILRRLFEMLQTGTLVTHSAYTLYESIIGFLVGVLLGSMIAAVAYKYRSMEELLTPMFNVVNSLPRIAFAPLIILFFGFGLMSKIIIVISLVFFVTFFFVLNELKNIKSSIIQRIELLEIDNMNKLRLVFLPALFNGIIKSLHLNMAFSFVGAIVGEYIGSSKGLGNIIDNAAAMFDTTTVFAGLLALTILVIIFSFLIKKITTKFSYLNN